MMASSTYTIRIAIRWWVHPVLAIALALGRIGLSGAAVSLCALVARRGFRLARR